MAELKGHAPGEVFYMALPVANDDGSVDPEMMIDGSYTYIEDALSAARDQVNDCNGEDDVYIFECKAVRRVYRGRVRIVPVRTKAAPKKPAE